MKEKEKHTHKKTKRIHIHRDRQTAATLGKGQMKENTPLWYAGDNTPKNLYFYGFQEIKCEKATF